MEHAFRHQKVNAAYPGISVVVPVYNAEALLSFCIEALERQNYPGAFEIIIVDNGSTDDSMKHALDRKRVRVIDCDRYSPAAARNEGVKEARYELIAFTDSDCIPKHDWLSELAKALSVNYTGVGGAIESATTGRIPDFIAKISFNQELLISDELPYIATCNALFRRKALIDIGLFDEGLRIAGGEDNDLGWRLSSRGHKIKYAPKAVCQHQHPTKIMDFASQRFRYGFGEGELIKKHGELPKLNIKLDAKYLFQEWLTLCRKSAKNFKLFLATKDSDFALGIVSSVAYYLGLLRSYIAPKRIPSKTASEDPASNPIMCMKPWTSFEVDDQYGNVVPCCWTKKIVGNVNEDSIGDIWNGEGYQSFRRAMLNNDYEEICPSDCPHRIGILQEVIPTAGHSKNFTKNIQHLSADLEERKTQLNAHPISVRILPSIKCNLDCIMCWQRVQDDQDLPPSFFDDLRKIAPKLNTVVLQGGEPLAIRKCREMLLEYDRDKFPDLSFTIMTNGTLLSETLIKKWKNTKIEHIYVSIDAATAETYSIVRGGDFERVIQGIERIKKWYPHIAITVGFVVMQENVHELRKFIELAVNLNVEFEFSPLNPGYKKGDDFADATFRSKLKNQVNSAHYFLKQIGHRNDSLETIKHRMWNENFRSFSEDKPTFFELPVINQESNRADG